MKASGVMFMKLQDQFGQSAVATAWVFSLFTTFLLMMGNYTINFPPHDG